MCTKVSPLGLISTLVRLKSNLENTRTSGIKFSQLRWPNRLYVKLTKQMCIVNARDTYISIVIRLKKQK